MGMDRASSCPPVAISTYAVILNLGNAAIIGRIRFVLTTPSMRIISLSPRMALLPATFIDAVVVSLLGLCVLQGKHNLCQRTIELNLLTVVFEMGTGVSPKRIATRNVLSC